MPRLRPVIEQIDPAGDPKEKVEVTASSEQIENKSPEKEVRFEQPTSSDAVVVEAVEPPSEASQALQKQIEALKKSEEIQRNRADQFMREREQALAKAREREVEVTRFQKEATRSQFDAVSTALAAAQAEAESAKRDMRVAITNGDVDTQTDAYERLATARANISKLEDGKDEIETRLKAPALEPEKIAQSDDPIERQIAKLPENAKDWIRKHPEYMTNPRLNARIQSWHYDAQDAGLTEFSKEYIDFFDEKAGFKKPAAPAKKDDDDGETPSTSIVSAPVSRETPSSSTQPRGGKVKLNEAQREAAKLAGITETEYAKQLQKFNDFKASGHYGERQ